MRILLYFPFQFHTKGSVHLLRARRNEIMITPSLGIPEKWPQCPRSARAVAQINHGSVKRLQNSIPIAVHETPHKWRIR